jgi:hypothetical protein
MARGAERHQAVEVEVRAPLGALDDVLDVEAARDCAISYLFGLGRGRTSARSGLPGRGAARHVTGLEGHR